MSLFWFLLLFLVATCRADGINPCHPLVFISNAFHVDAFFSNNNTYGVVEVEYLQWRYSAVNETVVELAACASFYNGRYAIDIDGMVAMVHYARNNNVLMITNLDKKLRQTFYVKMQ